MKRKIIQLVWFFALLPFLPADGYDVVFERIGEDIWIHRSYELASGFLTPSNGLLIAAGNNAILIDTAWNDEETRQILDFARAELGKAVTACVITHSHQDRAGGVDILVNDGISIYMNDLTANILLGEGHRFNYAPLTDGIIEIDGCGLHAEYYGAAHSPDNIVVWLPREKLLFGGCMVKALGAIGLGAAADPENWRSALTELLARHADAKIVVPGHGDRGGPELVEHTLRLTRSANGARR